jgi:NAD(P)-dependent dehydrogenase (short-subunit alcohol dehydrogenase family)
VLAGRRVALTPSARPALAGRLAALGAVLAGPGDAADPADALVVDEPPGADLVAWSTAVWERVRPLAAVRGAQLVLVAPPEGEPARAALENLARTLSIEWARFGIRTACVAPGPATADATLAEVVAYLLSPAGAYVSGSRLDLGGPSPTPP